MSKDLKNVIITFGLIAIVFMQGSFAYQKKFQKEYYSLIIQKQNEELEKVNQNILLNQKQKEELVKQKALEEQLAIKIADSQKNTANQIASNKSQAEINRQKALILAQQQAQAQADQQAAQALANQQAAQQKAQAKAQAMVKPSRQSSAS